MLKFPLELSKTSRRYLKRPQAKELIASNRMNLIGVRTYVGQQTQTNSLPLSPTTIITANIRAEILIKNASN